MVVPADAVGTERGIGRGNLVVAPMVLEGAPADIKGADVEFKAGDGGNARRHLPEDADGKAVANHQNLQRLLS